MKSILKKARAHWKALLALLALIVGIIFMMLATGCAGHPPTAFEQRMFSITTNYTPVLQVQTNVIPVTLIQTNYLVITNVQGVHEFKTNLVPYFVYETNVVRTVVTNEDYVYAPGAGSKAVQATGTAVGNVFGVGGLVGTGLGALFSLWGFVRSSKRNAVAVNLAQSIETMREFVKQLPRGAEYDNELVNFLTVNQANAGVLQQVIGLLASQVSNPSAKAAADQVMATIDALRNLPPKA